MNVYKKSPKLTGTYSICPIPFKFDPYIGCNYGCKYCFARDIVSFARKTQKNLTKEETSFCSFSVCDVDYFRKWVSYTLNKESTNLERNMFKNRIPLKIGVVSDPFPLIENKEKITYNILKILNEIDYPVQISTKNPSILESYIDDFIFDNRIPNWALSVTLITINENIRKQIEPNAPTVQQRLDSIKNIINKGVNVTVRIQPIIYPYIMNEIKDFIKKLSDIGVKTVIVEGLKIKCMLDKNEKKIYSEIGDILGYDILKFYKENGEKDGTDYIIAHNDKLKYIEEFKKYGEIYNVEINVGDNDCRNCSNSDECCNTKNLRNHKTFLQCENLLHTTSTSRGKKKCIYDEIIKKDVLKLN